jgi:hypothetical protein
MTTKTAKILQLIEPQKVQRIKLVQSIPAPPSSRVESYKQQLNQKPHNSHTALTFGISNSMAARFQQHPAWLLNTSLNLPIHWRWQLYSIG